MGYLILGNGSAASDITSLASLKKIAGIKTIKIQNCPMLTSLEGLHNVRETISIEISQTGITDLRGLRSLKTFNSVSWVYEMPSQMYLHHNNALVSLNGLQKLTTIPDLRIYTCSAFKSFHGLEKCKILSLVLINCPALTSFPANIQIGHACQFIRTGIVNLNGLKIASGAIVNLSENQSLSSLGNAFENITTLDSFYCSSNPSLVSLKGLESLTTVNQGVTIESNASLKNLCALTSFAAGDNFGSISGNYNPVTLSTLNSGNCSVE